MDLLVIGQQTITDYNGRIDLLAIDRDGALIIIELKRAKTPRDIVGQTLDYASWVASLTTRRIHEIANNHLVNKPLEQAFREKFKADLPENLNATHRMVIVASEFDASSKRIVEYLAEEHGLSINSIFFNVFEENGTQYLATEWLMDQQQVEERAQGIQGPPWTGYYYVNAGHEPDNRSWADMRKFGFIAAGGGRQYSRPLDRLEVNTPIYVYQGGCGYVGFGRVRSTSVPSNEFQTANGELLRDLDLEQPAIFHDPDNLETTEYIVGVDWITTFPLDEARRFPGAFSNANIVCRLKDVKTLRVLAEVFGE